MIEKEVKHTTRVRANFTRKEVEEILVSMICKETGIPKPEKYNGVVATVEWITSSASSQTFAKVSVTQDHNYNAPDEVADKAITEFYQDRNRDRDLPVYSADRHDPDRWLVGDPADEVAEAVASLDNPLLDDERPYLG